MRLSRAGAFRFTATQLQAMVQQPDFCMWSCVWPWKTGRMLWDWQRGSARKRDEENKRGRVESWEPMKSLRPLLTLLNTWTSQSSVKIQKFFHLERIISYVHFRNQNTHIPMYFAKIVRKILRKIIICKKISKKYLKESISHYGKSQTTFFYTIESWGPSFIEHKLLQFALTLIIRT